MAIHIKISGFLLRLAAITEYRHIEAFATFDTEPALTTFMSMTASVGE